MNTYDYRGYTINENENGYFWIEDAYTGSVYEFITYDEACDWVDETLNNDEEDYESEVAQPQLRTYHIFYVPEGANHGYDGYIEAYNPTEAIELFTQQEGDIEYITDIYEED